MGRRVTVDGGGHRPQDRAGGGHDQFRHAEAERSFDQQGAGAGGDRDGCVVVTVGVASGDAAEERTVGDGGAVVTRIGDHGRAVTVQSDVGGEARGQAVEGDPAHWPPAGASPLSLSTSGWTTGRPSVGSGAVDGGRWSWRTAARASWPNSGAAVSEA